MNLRGCLNVLCVVGMAIFLTSCRHAAEPASRELHVSCPPWNSVWKMTVPGHWGQEEVCRDSVGFDADRGIYRKFDFWFRSNREDSADYRENLQRWFETADKNTSFHLRGKENIRLGEREATVLELVVKNQEQPWLWRLYFLAQSNYVVVKKITFTITEDVLY